MVPRAVAVVLSVASVLAACSGDTESDRRDAAAGSAGGSGTSASGGSSGAAGTGASAGSGGGAGATGAAGSSVAGAGGSGGSAGADAAGGSGGTASAGRDGGRPDAPTSCPDGGTPDASAQDAIRASCTVAVVRVSEIEDECSGLGGTHVVFSVVEIGRGSAVTMLRYGGHGYFPPADGPRTVGQYFVAGIDALDGLMPRPMVWCTGGPPDVDGEVHTLLAAANEADARAKMRGLIGP